MDISNHRVASRHILYFLVQGTPTLTATIKPIQMETQTTIIGIYINLIFFQSLLYQLAKLLKIKCYRKVSRSISNRFVLEIFLHNMIKHTLFL